MYNPGKLNRYWPLNLLRIICIVLLLFTHSCECNNPNTIQTYNNKVSIDKSKPIAGIQMKAIPKELFRGNKDIQLSFILSKEVSIEMVKNYRLEVICLPSTPSNLTNYIEYFDASNQPKSDRSINEKLAYFIGDILAEESKAFVLSFKLKPDIEAAQVVIKFQLFNEKNILVQGDEVEWKTQLDEAIDPRLELQGEANLVGNNRKFTIKVSNEGTKNIEANQVKLLISRIEGASAALSLDGQEEELQEVILERLDKETNIIKNFVVRPGTDKKTAFMLQLVYMGNKIDPPVYVNWKHSYLEISQLYYCRPTNQIYYQVSNSGLPQKDAVELVYKNLSNNKATIAGLSEDAILLGDLRNLAHPYSSLQVDFNGESSAEFEFKLRTKGEVIETKKITLNNIRLGIEGIQDGGVFRGKNQLKLYIKNTTGLPINIENIYIQCTTDNHVDFEWNKVDDVSVPTKLSTYTNKNILADKEAIPLHLQLKDAHGKSNSALTLQIQEHCGGKTSVLKEISLNWLAD